MLNKRKAIRQPANFGYDRLNFLPEPAALVPTGAPIPFLSPVHMLAVVRPNFVLYPWQKDILLRLAGYKEGKISGEYEEPTEAKPFRLCMPAANGSGKDMVVIAALAVWACLRFPKTLIVITTASWEQIKNQTEPHIVSLITDINNAFGKIFRSISFDHVCIQTGSKIHLVVSDEPGRIEGWHPAPGGKMLIIVNEAKSVPDEIYDALDSCTGYSWWLEVSSPAAKAGRFYRSSIDAICFPAKVQYSQYYFRRVTAYECPHISREHIARMIATKPRWWVQYSIEAEFFSMEEDFVLTEDLLLELKAAKVQSVGSDFGIGWDIGAGGDSSEVFVRCGNEILCNYSYNESNVVQQAKLVDDKLKDLKINPEGSYTFYADDGGVGHGAIDALSLLGWRVVRCHNQAAADEKDLYANFGAEVYFHLKKLVQQKLIPYCDNEILNRQLCSRRYKQQLNGKSKLEPKPEHRKRCKESPDRADAYGLCYNSLRINSVRELLTQARRAPAPKMSLVDLERMLRETSIGETQSNIYANGTYQRGGI